MADRMGPIVDPQGESFLTQYSWYVDKTEIITIKRTWSPARENW